MKVDHTKGTHYATSYALKADELYTGFPTKKYISVKASELPKRYARNFNMLYGEMFRYFFYLIIKDIILNQTIFKLPPGGLNAWIQMDPISGEDFIKARQNGAFEDVDYLASDFTGYSLYLKFNNRYGKWKKNIHVSKPYKDKITERTNKGLGW